MLRQLIVLDGSELVDLCVEQLQSTDKDLMPCVQALLVLIRYHSERQQAPQQKAKH
jgi:hypothetical protein